jgi:hypothetical protein
LPIRKEDVAAAQNERACPHIVEVPVPPNGLGAALVSMHAFHRERGLDLRRGRNQRREHQDFVRWCFRQRIDAEAFAKAFGGKLI